MQEFWQFLIRYLILFNFIIDIFLIEQLVLIWALIEYQEDGRLLK